MSWKRRVLNRMPIVLLLAFFALSMAQVRAASITFDEGPHLAVGYTTLRTGDLRLQPIHIHPPLANVLAASPLLLQDDLPDPRSVDGWRISSLSAITDAVVWQYPNPARIATAGRVPILLLGVLLCAMVHRWASDLGGHNAGLLALGLTALDPNLIAHSAVITTDAAAVTLSVATLFLLSRAIQAAGTTKTRSAGYLVLTGVLLGLSQLAKVSALMLVPVVGLMILVASWSRERSFKRTIAVSLRDGAIVCLTAGLVLWGGYGFEISDVPGVPFRVPAATHLRIYQSLRDHYDLGHPTFALGRVSRAGWWWYFPVAFAVKTPLPTWILLVAAGLTAVHRLVVAFARSRSHRFGGGRASYGTLRLANGQAMTLSALLLFPSLYAFSSLFSTVNIGYRHLLPLLPFAYIGTALVLTRLGWPRERAWARAVVIGLCGWLAIGTVAVAPHFLAFFNAPAGGPQNGYRLLVDSNLDWGQDLWELADWMARHDQDQVFYAHYSPADPAVYGVPVSFLPPDPRAGPYTPWRPQPGLYAIGATVLQGPYAPDINTYAWFRDREPAVRPGNALFVYEVPPQPAPAWAMVCDPAWGDTELKQRLGVETLRVIRPNCDEARVYPDDSEPGRHVIPATLAAPTDRSPQFSLRDEAGRITESIYVVNRAAVPQANLTGQMNVDGPLAFVGYTLTAPAETTERGTTLSLETYWDVVEIPGRPLSLMAHAVAGDGQLVAVGDGLGFPIEQWRVGDRIVQTHHLQLPPQSSAAGTITLQTGGYWLDTLDRWTVNSSETSIVLLTQSLEAGR